MNVKNGASTSLRMGTTEQLPWGVDDTKYPGSSLEPAEVLGGYRVWLQLLLSSAMSHFSCSQVLQYFQSFQCAETCQIDFSKLPHAA